MTCGIQLTDVDLTNSIVKSGQNEIGLGHCCVQLLSMCQVNAKQGFRKPCKPMSQLICGTPVRLSTIHVFYDELFPEICPLGCVLDSVRVKDDFPILCAGMKQLNYSSFLVRAEGTRSMQRNVSVAAQVQRTRGLHQSRQFLNSQGGKLDCGKRPTRHLLKSQLKVALRQSARRES